MRTMEEDAEVPKWKSWVACTSLWLAYLFSNSAYSSIVPFFPGLVCT